MKPACPERQRIRRENLTYVENHIRRCLAADNIERASALADEILEYVGFGSTGQRAVYP